MKVVKRNGDLEDMCLSKITERLAKLCQPIGPLARLEVDCVLVAQKTCAGLSDGIATSRIDEISSDVAISLTTTDPDYEGLAARILASDLHKKTSPSVLHTFRRLRDFRTDSGVPMPLVSAEVMDAVEAHQRELQDAVNYDSDYDYSYFGLKTLLKGYLQPKDRPIERPQHMLLRVSLGIWGPDIDQALATYSLLARKLYTHATPSLFNLGTCRAHSASCYLMGTEDSIEALAETWKKCCIISKSAGGIGLNVSNVRGSNALIRGTGGRSNGLVPMAQTFNMLTKWVTQGGKRQGALAMYLEPWHVDVYSFIQLRRPQGAEDLRTRNLFLALWVSDLFMERVVGDGMWSLMDPDASPGLTEEWGDAFRTLYTEYERQGRFVRQVRAQDLWNMILRCQIESGMPYILNKCTSNATSNQQNLGTIKCSNLCVAPDTLLLTDRGHIKIEDLAGEKVKVWTGTRFAQTTVVKTGKDQPMVEVSLSGYKRIHCTPYHRFEVQTGYTKSSRKVVEAKDLQRGMKIVKCSYPTIPGGTHFPSAYTHGFFCGDGTYSKPGGMPYAQCVLKAADGGYCQRHAAMYGEQSPACGDGRCKADVNARQPLLFLYKDKIPLAQHLDIRSTSSRVDAQGRVNCTLHPSIPPKFHVPFEADLACRVEWLAGLADADGCVTVVNGNHGLQISSVHVHFLQQVCLMLQTMGVDACVSLMRLAADRVLPDGKGQTATYHCQDCFRLLITHAGLAHLVACGFQPRRLRIDLSMEPQRAARRFTSVVSVAVAPVSDTYCFHEPGEQHGVFNGVLTMNCAEVMQYSDHHQTSVCNLASVALSRFVRDGAFDHKHLHEVVQRVVTNLDHMLDVCAYPVDDARHTNLRDRPLGVGVQGLADVFMMLRLPFESAAASRLNKDIFETMHHAALTASAGLARAHGPYPSYEGSPLSRGLLQFDLWGQADSSGNPVDSSGTWDWGHLRADLKEHGARNSLLMANMPTCSTSQILNNNESFQPVNSNIYSRRTGAGSFTCINKYLVKDLQALGLWGRDVKDEIIRADGSIQGIGSIPADTKELYKTIWEIKQKACIDMAADRGPFICQSQSLNLFLPETSMRKLSAMLMHAWKRRLPTMSYYCHLRPESKNVQVTIAPFPKAQCESCSA